MHLPTPTRLLPISVSFACLDGRLDSFRSVVQPSEQQSSCIDRRVRAYQLGEHDSSKKGHTQRGKADWRMATSRRPAFFNGIGGFPIDYIKNKKSIFTS
jgi:hypothetical protein